MKLNKILVAAAVAVLPLSVANAEGKVETAKGTPLVNEKAPYAEKGPALVNEEPKEFTGAAKGTPLVNEKAPYAEKGASLVNEKPEFKLDDLKKPATPATPAKRVLPKTHAVK